MTDMDNPDNQSLKDLEPDLREDIRALAGICQAYLARREADWASTQDCSLWQEGYAAGIREVAREILDGIDAILDKLEE